MGSHNGTIYDGEYIHPIKISQDKKVNKVDFNFDRMFGRIDTTRALPGDLSNYDNISTSNKKQNWGSQLHHPKPKQSSQQLIHQDNQILKNKPSLYQNNFNHKPLQKVHYDHQTQQHKLNLNCIPLGKSANQQIKKQKGKKKQIIHHLQQQISRLKQLVNSNLNNHHNQDKVNIHYQRSRKDQFIFQFTSQSQHISKVNTENFASIQPISKEKMFEEQEQELVRSIITKNSSIYFQTKDIINAKKQLLKK